ncbi:hypothetical protein QCA50_018909 [Cerrena zonata]|uniref:Uncharacterized protein n=1 Tax=Cerrena zonata TaxID=2478898 RepID=A0AAW0FC76_9APHY
MSEQLHFNICNFETSGEFNHDCPDHKDRIEKHISPELRYASMYWWHHLKEIRTWREDVGLALRLFSKEKLLFWLELVGLDNRDIMGFGAVWAAQNVAYTFAIGEDHKLVALWNTVRMFIKEYSGAIAGNVLHIYVLAHSPPFTEIHINSDSPTGTIAALVHNHDIFPRILSSTMSLEAIW